MADSPRDRKLASSIHAAVSALTTDCRAVLLPPEGGLEAVGQSVIPFALVRGTRGYLERIVHQINGSYSHGWYDACAVMIRRLLETLIIETYEHHGIAAKIQNPKSGDFFYLADLISATLSEPTWNLGRNTKAALPRLKDIGDKSAHSRRFNAVRNDLDRILSDVRTVVQEFVYLAKLK